MDAPREIAKAMRLFATKYPILVLTGPRQAGKTTMLKSMFSDYTYVSLENPDLRNFAERDPNGFFKVYSEKIILDEVQQVPSLFSYLQTNVDENRKMGQFILSGSQNFQLLEKITQSLAGRVAIFKLLPYDFNELKSINALSNDYVETMIRGFYPALFDRDIPSKSFYSNYLQTYVERDMTTLVNVKDLRTFRNFVSLCAARVGQLLSLNSLANECGITQPTAKSWLSLLEASYVVFLLQPHWRNFNKRITKSPKLYFYDTGLLCYLLKMKDPEKLKSHPYKGCIFENMIVAEALKRNYHQNLDQQLWFWRDSNGNEVDLLIDDDELMDAVEIKSTETIMPNLFKGLDYYERIAEGDVKSKTLVYGGNQSQERTSAKVAAWQMMN